MTKTVEEVRRAAFEVAYLKQFGRYPDNWCNVISKYLNAHAQGAWWAWQAALDSVEIQLPELAGGFADHVNEHAQTVFLDAIEQTGLGLKVKP
jgi:hypothetical protein